MTTQYILAAVIVLALAIMLRINHVTLKSKNDSLAFWQQRFNVVATDFHDLQKDHDVLSDLISTMRAENGKLANEVFQCNFYRNRE